jgi:signal transduction histidine kinase
MKISIRQKLLLFSLVTLLGIGFTGYAVYESNQKLRDSEQWVRHTEQVIGQSDKILSLVKDIETASRGFVITNDSTFLEPLYNAQKTGFVFIEQLGQLTQDNPLQQSRVDSLNLYMHKRLNFSFQSAALRSRKGLAAAITYISSKEGNGYSVRLRQITYTIQEEEKILLKQRKQTNEYSVATFNRFSVFMFILMVASVILLLITSGKYLLQTKEKEIRAAELIIANKELAFQNKENEKMATELIIANKELVFQNKEKERRAAELTIANKELGFQNKEKEKRAAELIIINRDLKASEEQFKEVNKELESFSYSVSHDLRAPLRAVNGYARMLEERYGTQLDPEANRLMNNIRDNAIKMGQLIDDLLSFSHIGRKDLVKMHIPMYDMVTNICNELKNEQGVRNIEFDIRQLLPAQADSITLRQVWLNLISNAIKYSKLKEKTIIEIGSENNDGEIVYYIKDNGAGFDMRYANKLFDIFQRLHSDEEFEGTGIGLAIVKRIIFKHGGRIWADGKVNEGAIFYFTLNKSLQHEPGNRNFISRR